MNRLDLDAYFKRISYDGPRTATLAVLQDLQFLHPTSIPFEAVDVYLRKEIPLNISELQEKLVFQRRGGYCFEHDILFMHVLKHLGFEVTPLIARLQWNVPKSSPRPRAHMILKVALDGSDWIADVGLGTLTPTAAVKLEEGAIQRTPHETVRIVSDQMQFMLQAKIDGHWKDVYSFTLEEQFPIDLELANWWTSQHPTSKFILNLIAARAGKQGERYYLNDCEFVIRSGSGSERKIISSSEDLKVVLSTYFKLELSESIHKDLKNQLWPK